MTSPTYTVRGIVLRKTKLGEADLIVTMLAEDGSQVRAVAKGARKPRSSFAARLELYSTVEILCARGRNLDIVKEARLVTSHEKLRLDMEHAAAAAPIVELLERVTQVGLEHPRLFALTDAALSRLDGCPGQRAPVVTAACLLKILAFCGFRPNLTDCVGCGGPVDTTAYFSSEEGGAVCAACHRHVESVPVSLNIIQWMQYMLMTSFDEILGCDADAEVAFAVLGVTHQWIRAHVNVSMKSMNFLFTCGLYAS